MKVRVRTIQQLKCRFCRHEWFPKHYDVQPKTCPACRNNWRRAPIYKKAAK